MSRIFIYAFPALMDMVMASTMFVCTVRAAQMNCPPGQVAALVTMWSATYMVVCQVVARVITPRNAARLGMLGCGALAVTSGALIALPGLTPMYLLMAGVAAGAAFFFAPFQVFMKCVHQAAAKPVSYSAGLYVFAWSAGFAVGPFVAGYLWKTAGWQWCHALNAAAALLTAAGIFLLKHHGEARPAQPHPAEPQRLAASAAVDCPRRPDFARLGWLCGGLGVLTFALFRSIFPSSGEMLSFSEPAQGTVLFFSAAVQSAVGLALARTRTWMYRPMALVAFGLLGMLGLVLMARAVTPSGFYLAAACHGVYSGSFFFYMTFHSMVHPTRSSRYVSINESVVGGASIAGSFAGGQIANFAGLPASYLAGAAVVLAATLAQGVVHARRPAADEETHSPEPPPAFE